MSIATHEIAYQYPGRPKIMFPDLECNSRETLLVLGTSGRGKTTLLHLIAGLIPLQQGEVHIGGYSLKKLKGQTLDQFRGANVGLIFQQPHFIRSLTVAENLLLAQQLAGNSPSKKRVQTLLGRLGIGEYANRLPRFLSVGEQQRASIARALVNQPSVILADEPTSSLDDQNAHKVATLLAEQAQLEDAALLIVTHDQRLVNLFPQHLRLS
ncbi:MAG: ATP-binding cassette domain-containing protein [Bacteroidota bacterium]